MLYIKSKVILYGQRGGGKHNLMILFG